MHTAQLHLIVFTTQCSHWWHSTDSLRHYNVSRAKRINERLTDWLTDIMSRVDGKTSRLYRVDHAYISQHMQ